MNVGADEYISIERERFEGPVEGYPLCEVHYLILDLIIQTVGVEIARRNF